MNILLDLAVWVPHEKQGRGLCVEGGRYKRGEREGAYEVQAR